MAKAYIGSHGDYDPAWWQTQVPSGLSVAFYADFDETASQQVGHGVLAAGDVAPRQEYAAEEMMPNYALAPLTSDEMVNALVSLSSRLPGKLYLVGVDIPVGSNHLAYLCTTPFWCTYRIGQGHHPQCEGLLGPEFLTTHGIDELHLMACRGQRGAQSSTTTEMDAHIGINAQGEHTRVSHYGDSPKAYDEALYKEMNRIFEWADRDPQAAMTYVYSLPQATLVALRTTGNFTEWLEVMQHPLTEASPQADINTWARRIKSPEGLQWWRALPEASRRVLVARTGKALAAFLADLASYDQISAAPAATARYRAPRDFDTAWSIPSWRKDFWRWLNDNPPTDINAERLLTLHKLLHPKNPNLISLPADTFLEFPAGPINPHPHGLPEDIERLGQVYEFFTVHWNPAPEAFAPTVIELSHLWEQLTAPRALDPTQQSTAEYLAAYRHLQANGILPDDYTPPEGADPDNPDPTALANDPYLTAWTWMCTTRDYTQLTPFEQAELSAWVYATDPDLALSFDELPANTRAEIHQTANTLENTLLTTTNDLLQDLHTRYRTSTPTT